jgi:hypothetical protein
MSAHYCMGRLSSVQLELAATKKCGCGKSESKKCCKTELKVFKIADTQKAASASYDVKAPFTIVAQEINIFTLASHTPVERHLYHTHSPPLLSAQDTYLRNCVFRI